MITNDPYGISRAVRVWNSLDAKERPRERKRKVNQAAIDMCLNCPLEFCKGNCKERPKGKRTYKDPCLSCYSRDICKQNGYICNDKARWKPRTCMRGLSFDANKAEELFYSGMKFAEIGRALGVKGETIRKWAKRKGLKRNG